MITGASGFVGKKLVKEMLKRQPKSVLHLLIQKKDDRNNDLLKQIKDLKAVKTYEMDLLDQDSYKKLPINFTNVIYLAAQTDTALSDHKVNDAGLGKFLVYLDKNPHLRQVIYMGTMVNFVGRPNCSQPLNEAGVYFPTNRYTRSKSAGEKLLVDYCKNRHIKLTILIPNTIYGVGMREGSLFKMLNSMIRRRSYVTRLNWPGKSALVHVDDVVTAILFFNKSQIKRKKLIDKYLLYSQNLTIAELAEIMHNKLEIGYKPIILPKIAWQVLKKCRRLLFIPERVLPTQFYNYLWRLSIIIDDSVNAESGKLAKTIHDWRPKKFTDSVNEVLD